MFKSFKAFLKNLYCFRGFSEKCHFSSWTSRTIPAALRKSSPNKVLFPFASGNTRNLVGITLPSIYRSTTVLRAVMVCRIPSAIIKEITLFVKVIPCSCRNLNSFSPAMVWEAPVSAHTAIFSPKILRTITLEGYKSEFKLNNVIQFTSVSISFVLVQVHVDLTTPGVPHP
ncbi:hypothetical protein TNCT_514361 [Trichonephila clavata]|uniref:Uncharacterized protein n=1 Tax=Trichonephila clavata TaxID=2740835 RepID=A0A8X6H8B3_TRICU|nr:hypothetical protein TNCT_514361 [Trichonephila clavata]